MHQTLINAPCAVPCETLRRERRNTYTPRVDIFESDDALVLYADLPGVKPEELELHLKDGELIVHGHVSMRTGRNVLMMHEYDAGDFRRVFRLPKEIDAEGITASLSDGVLLLRLPKSSRYRPRQIEVKE